MQLSLSVLEQLPVFHDSTHEAAVQEAVDLAVATEKLGYKRFWVAEHHGDPTRACASPAVLMAAIAALTTQMRVGSGCTLLPYSNPLRVAEEFRMLLALAPGRIDLGVGNGMGATAAADSELRRSGASPVTYAKDIQELTALLTTKQRTQQPLAVPLVEKVPELWVTASSLRGALVAAALGRPLSLAHFFGGDSAYTAAAAYRDAYLPSPGHPLPRVSVAVRVTCADSLEEAEAMANSFWIPAIAQLRGSNMTSVGSPFRAYPSMEDIRGYEASAEDLELRSRNRHLNLVGPAEDLIVQLSSIAQRYGANELMLTTVCPDLSARLHSYRIIAKHAEAL